MLLYLRRRKTWLCCAGQSRVKGQRGKHMCLTRPSTPLYSVVMNCSSLSVCSVLVHRHVMNELLETERAYVEELLCVLQVSESVNSFINEIHLHIKELLHFIMWEDIFLKCC